MTCNQVILAGNRGNQTANWISKNVLLHCQTICLEIRIYLLKQEGRILEVKESIQNVQTYLQLVKTTKK